ncbi:methyltransferase [Methyloglobulus morosus KoM1]|uniref:Methyltransferase n=1 Tax=Methyloglobulus morosus KoM1 TaxID=1116472 RepID=V5C6P4_9GAMM|nr:class I SAM-dependent methyltransferase [Methyloglobulus morosus]ESS74097.1 methyltransferase [Methyloglobulus morosus KoM1]
MNVKRFTSWEEAVAWLIAQPEQQELVRACYFDRPALPAAQRYWQSDEWCAVRKLLPANIGRVLDVGAGMGIASYALGKDGWQVTALEPDPSNLVGAGAIRQLASKAGLEITVVEKWGERLPFADASFDVIHARQVLHHARDLEQFCKELYRVLKPGGRLIATREHVISDASQLPKFLAKHSLQNLYGGENAFQRKEYLSSLKAAGFSILSVLGPWDSIINSTPFTRHKLAEFFLARYGHWLGASMISRIIFTELGFQFVRQALALVDRRPGRLYTFVADKPEQVQ